MMPKRLPTVQRSTMGFVATKTAEQPDLRALHRVRERLVSQRSGIINQIRAFMLERGIADRPCARRDRRSAGPDEGTAVGSNKGTARHEEQAMA